ncbi:hypothetical protein [Methylobacterium aquaticum]|jgi:hypothetical protein|uniref:Uncharacterized protein n=1 Tax=Methylobacterium aquaticum TaxID=270351 RepID=A0A0J6RWY9_9HYPH|nr:hypothetical protein [Methylobacterium aquaticum]KMO27370.1 hypothetical protein VP06_30955 [Methylobacterium aquaticum]
MDAFGRETPPPSLLRRTGTIALIAIAGSLAATHFLASRSTPSGPGGQAMASLRGLVDPETTGSIAAESLSGSAARTRLDPCGAPLRP